MSPEQRAARIRLVVLDVDGVLTDGRLYYGPQGPTRAHAVTVVGHDTDGTTRSTTLVTLVDAFPPPAAR